MTAYRMLYHGHESNTKRIYEIEACSVPDKCHMKSGEILGKVLLSTICGSDLHTLKGLRKEKVPRCVFYLGENYCTVYAFIHLLLIFPSICM